MKPELRIVMALPYVQGISIHEMTEALDLCKCSLNHTSYDQIVG